MKEGMAQAPGILYVKAIMDFFTAAIFSVVTQTC
ncbi:hypothetical protein [Erwinia tracheiphila]|uniref:Uncharacterized protein n=1 Tax=Erwinia tracheiphila TaxID=65700 RepID=A0A345CNZ5_9GAMM|nr:hypothetical protein AV903_02050 [Erwinia tracheiphila]